MATATTTSETPRERTPIRPPIRCSAELAECTCPEYCDRDHDRD